MEYVAGALQCKLPRAHLTFNPALVTFHIKPASRFRFHGNLIRLSASKYLQ